MEVQSVFKIDRKTLKDWEDPEASGSLKPKYPKTRKARKIPPDALIEYVDANPGAFLREIAAHIDCSEEGVHKALGRLGYTRKKR